MPRALFLVLVTLLVGLGVAVAWSEPSPSITFDESTPDDLRELAATTWQQFVDLHPARLDCLGHVRLAASWDMDSRAEYRPDSALIVVRVPGTAATLRSGMVHEFAHHVEFTCDSHHEMRSGFLRAQGFSPTDSWFDGPSWETTPSEQYAEAMVELMLGDRHHHGNILVSERALAVVRQWAAGS